MFSQNPRQPSSAGGSHSFAQVPKADIPRSSFDRSHGHKTTMEAADLIPIMVDEALPGDTMTCNLSMFARFATPLHPIMDNIYMDTFWFAVPMRLLWDNWQKFNGEQTDPGDSTDFVIPQIFAPGGGGWIESSMADYFGIPTQIASFQTSVMFHRAYNLIYNEWFRDENLVDSIPKNMDDGPDNPGDYTIRQRGKRKDYFTGCLPWPQKGPAVELPLGVSAPVVGSGTGIPIFEDAGDLGVQRQLINTAAPTPTPVLTDGATPIGGGALIWVNPRLEADLSSATSATINAIRQAFQIQKLYERDARGGTRYTEILKSHFGVTSDDARLQRPEYLGGSHSNLNFNVVPQTGEAGSTPQGHLGAFGTISATGSGFQKSFTEHCIIMGIASARADLTYQQGLNKMFSRSTRWDFFWPALSHIGEQSVTNLELFADGTANDDIVFGYQERWAEYRYKPSIVTSFMRSNSAVPLDSWHLAQDFASAPVLDETFITENPPIARVVAVPSEATFIVDMFFNYTCVRPMPTYSVPGLIDHF